MNARQEIVEYLQKKYTPVAIILHGSRAVGREREHSDWDIIFLCAGAPTQTNNREEIYGQNVEWKVFRAPDGDVDIVKTFATYLQFATVLWEKESVGSELLRAAAARYAQGPCLSDDQKRREKLFFTHKIQGMEDDQATPYMFARHVGRLTAAAAELWFTMRANEYSQPLYLAMPRIEQEDPAFHADLLVLFGNDAPPQKIQAAKELYSRLFSYL